VNNPSDLRSQGLVPLVEWCAAQEPPLSPHTGHRYRRLGKIITRRLGNVEFVDVPATAARMRGEDRPQRRRLGKGGGA
jgi:hypothetical protein